MGVFEESTLYKVLSSTSSDAASVKDALGSAATDLSCRGSDGKTYIHLAAQWGSKHGKHPT